MFHTHLSAELVVDAGEDAQGREDIISGGA